MKIILFVNLGNINKHTAEMYKAVIIMLMCCQSIKVTTKHETEIIRTLHYVLYSTQNYTSVMFKLL